ncbi:hypothetical protein Tco_1118509, partial [Tanacetum coccineum]
SQKCIDEELKGDPTGAASPNERITLNLWTFLDVYNGPPDVHSN